MTIPEITNNISVLADRANKAGLFNINESMAIGKTVIETIDLLQEYELIKAELEILKAKNGKDSE